MSYKSDTVARLIICRDARVTWKEAQLSVNVVRLLRTREVRISMEDYLREVLDDFPEEIIVTPETPALENLFIVRYENEQDLLDKKWAQEFHHAVEQLLFIGIQFRKGAQTEIAFLKTRLRKSD